MKWPDDGPAADVGHFDLRRLTLDVRCKDALLLLAVECVVVDFGFAAALVEVCGGAAAGWASWADESVAARRATHATIENLVIPKSSKRKQYPRKLEIGTE